MADGMQAGSIKTNKLLNETSPYLLQHAHNPVNWYPWGKEAIERAGNEDKPILLSIGYAACHWCHVMAHESFEDPNIAEVMNQNFINIKVDREERPDLDDIYMKSVQIMTGHGGWPMTVFLTPELKPFFGGTYFPPQDRYGMPSFMRVLQGVIDAWKTKRNQIESSSNELTQYITGFDIVPAAQQLLNHELISESLKKILQSFDRQWGGLGNAPKFPHTGSLELAMMCLSSKEYQGCHQHCLEYITTTLNKMASGGINDQIGGGFARYSVDRTWLIPHFEKMLYDNATLSKIYLDGYLLLKNNYWADIAKTCLDFVLKELTAPNGAFYSSLDADSEGEEGKFYVWKPEQIIDTLGDDDGRFINGIYGITNSGNFEHGTSVPHLTGSPEEIANRYELSIEDFWSRVNSLNKKLLEARGKRIRPGRDEKILVSWNALMISSFVSGWKVLGEEKYRHAAISAADFILKNLHKNGRLLRTWAKDQGRLNAYLDDYAFLIQALLDLASADFNSRWLDYAISLNDTVLDHFMDSVDHSFFYTSDDHEKLIARSKQYFDGSTPSSTAITIKNLLRLHRLTGNNKYQHIAEQTLKVYAPHFSRTPDQFSNMLNALDFYLSKGSEIVLVADPTKSNWLQQFSIIGKSYLPRSVTYMHDINTSPNKNIELLTNQRIMVNNQPTVYICENFTCGQPITEIDELKARSNNLLL